MGISRNRKLFVKGEEKCNGEDWYKDYVQDAISFNISKKCAAASKRVFFNIIPLIISWLTENRIERMAGAACAKSSNLPY